MHKCENESLKIEGSRLKIFDGYYSDWDIYTINYCPLCGINLQPDRLNPEDVPFSHKDPVGNWGKLWDVCYSRIPENK